MHISPDDIISFLGAKPANEAFKNLVLAAGEEPVQAKCGSSRTDYDFHRSGFTLNYVWFVFNWKVGTRLHGARKATAVSWLLVWN